MGAAMVLLRITALIVSLCLLPCGVQAADPLDSPYWPELSERLFGKSPYVFDNAVKVQVPDIIENQAQVPVIADARALGDVKKLIVFADRNPIQLAIALEPELAAPFVGLRMKIEQSTPLRAAALTADGTWHVGGISLDAAGGGCTAPAMARGDANWSTTVGDFQGRIWAEADGYSRVRFRVRHPMDTGLARDNTPAFFIESVDLKTSSGTVLARVQPFEPVAEDPTLTLLVKIGPADSAVDIDSRDNNGGIYRTSVPARWNARSAVRPPS